MGISRNSEQRVPDLVKRKRQVTEESNILKVNMTTILTNDTEGENDIPNSHYTKSHWGRATIETSVWIGNIREPVVALIDHRLEINMMSKKFDRKGKWPINRSHGWKIQTPKNAT